MKKHERRRLITQAISFAFSNGYVTGFTKHAKNGSLYAGALKKICMPGLNCYSCPGAVLSCPIGALQAVLGSGTFRVSLYVLGFIGLIGMLFGRLICGWICPFGFIQELLYKIPFKKKRKNLPGHSKLIRLKYVLLGLVVLVPMLGTVLKGTGYPAFCAWICPGGTLLGGVPQLILNPELKSAAGFRFAVKLVLLILILALGVITYRPFCKYLCPLGALYGLMNPVSLYRYKVDAQKCISCGACQTVCGMDIKVWETPNSPECIRCGRCKAACPQKAITSSKEDLEAKLTAPDNDIKEEKKMFISKKKLALLLIGALLGAAVTALLLRPARTPAEQGAFAAPQTQAPAETGVLTVFCRTEDGTPIKDVRIQVCSGTLCQMLTSDENGLITYAGLPGHSYEITPVRAPEGYAFTSPLPVEVSGHGERVEIVLFVKAG